MTLSAAVIVATTAQVAGGLAECASGPWEVAVGTSNSGGATPFNGYDGGAFWAQIVEQACLASDPRVLISGANDIEPSWGPVAQAQARAWIDGSVAASTKRLWNFGSADGCPQSGSQARQWAVIAARALVLNNPLRVTLPPQASFCSRALLSWQVRWSCCVVVYS